MHMYLCSCALFEHPTRVTEFVNFGKRATLVAELGNNQHKWLVSALQLMQASWLTKYVALSISPKACKISCKQRSIGAPRMCNTAYWKPT